MNTLAEKDPSAQQDLIALSDFEVKLLIKLEEAEEKLDTQWAQCLGVDVAALTAQIAETSCWSWTSPAGKVQLQHYTLAQLVKAAKAAEAAKAAKAAEADLGLADAAKAAEASEASEAAKAEAQAGKDLLELSEKLIAAEQVTSRISEQLIQLYVTTAKANAELKAENAKLKAEAAKAEEALAARLETERRWQTGMTAQINQLEAQIKKDRPCLANVAAHRSRIDTLWQRYSRGADTMSREQYEKFRMDMGCDCRAKHRDDDWSSSLVYMDTDEAIGIRRSNFELLYSKDPYPHDASAESYQRALKAE